MALIFISKLRRNVLMATILSALVTINRYAPSAMLAGDNEKRQGFPKEIPVALSMI